MKISPKYKEKDWDDAFNGPENWDKAIDIVEDRIKGRWLNSADQLLCEPHSGFAILALDCIVLESLWGFIHGKGVPAGSEQQVYRDILMRPSFGFSVELCDSFRKLVRNGIMHDAETRHRWLVESSIPIHTIAQENGKGDCVLNRTEFHRVLTAVFQDWIAKLRGGDAELRGNMRQRMNQIIQRHYGP